MSETTDTFTDAQGRRYIAGQEVPEVVWDRYRQAEARQVRLGDTMHYTASDGMRVVGTLVAMERTASSIRDTKTGQEWPGIRFKVQPTRGSAVWTCTYPDKRGVT